MTFPLGGWAGYLMGFIAVLVYEALLSVEIVLAVIRPSEQAAEFGHAACPSFPSR